jgi:Uma2 family endonuclease
MSSAEGVAALATGDGRLFMMPTLVLDPPPAEFERILEQRRRAGADRHDEVWEGVLHMAPAPSHRHGRLVIELALLLAPPAKEARLEVTDEINLGDSEHDYRVPDLALHRPGAPPLWHPTAALIVEILSPGDETQAKLPFYAAHHVEEVLIVDPDRRTSQWLALGAEGYRLVEGSALIDLTTGELDARIDWPA